MRPGGEAAFVTSKGTMDKNRPEVHRYLAQGRSFWERSDCRTPGDDLHLWKTIIIRKGCKIIKKGEYFDYKAARTEWEKTYGEKATDSVSIIDKLRQKEQIVKEREAGRVTPNKAEG